MHPYFSELPDRYVAETLSEGLEPGVYKNNFTTRGTPFTAADGFPPEPSYLTSITAAFIERDESIRTASIHGISGRKHEPKPAELVKAYEDGVGIFQDQIAIYETAAEFMDLPDTYPQFGRLGSWCIEVVRAEEKRLVAAHMVFTAISGRLHTGLSYHAAVKEQFPLMVRDVIGPAALEHPDSQFADIIRKVMRNDEEAQAVAGIPPSAVMPPVDKFKAGLSMHSRQSRKRR